MAIKPQLFWYQFMQTACPGIDKPIDPTKGIGSYVYIQAPDTNLAIKKAYKLGIYFDGVKKGKDCAQCGDRWNRPISFAGGTPLDAAINMGEIVYAHQYNTGAFVQIIPN